MSTVVMSACWDLQMPPTPKAVLISLADNANDHGDCWPSISKICRRTCFKKTAVIDAIAWLESTNALKTNKSNGRHTSYQLTPDEYQEPVRETNRSVKQTGTADGLKPDRLADNRYGKRTEPVRQTDTNRNKPSLKATVKSNRKKIPACSVDRPAEVSEQIWGDWLILRKAKNAPVTETVLTSAIGEAAKARLSLEAFFAIWCARGSQGLQADWLKPQERATYGGMNGKPSAAASFHGKTYTGTLLEDLPEDLRPKSEAM